MYMCVSTSSPSYKYSLQPILFFGNTGASMIKIYLDTSILVKSNMDRRKYFIFENKVATQSLHKKDTYIISIE
jgi:hypothetical protein